MLTTLKTAIIAGLIGLTSLAAVPAQADSVYLGFGDRHDDTRFGIYLGDSSRTHYRRDRWDDDWRRDDWRRDEWRRSERRCTPGRALDKAERMGIRRARIDYVSRREIGVIGRSHGDRVSVIFARSRNCAVIG